MPYAGAPSDPLRARAVPAIYRSNALATPNYSYEKRQRELAKKRKKEEKAARKAQGGSSNTSDEQDQPPAEGNAPSEGEQGSQPGNAG